MSEKTLANTRGHPRGRKRSAVVMALSLASLMLFAAPAGAASSGTIDATITVEGPCVTVPTLPINFGSVGFSQTKLNTTDTAGSFAVANCAAGQTQQVYAQASGAAGSGSAKWTVNQWDGTAYMCTLGANIFAAGLSVSGSTAVYLATGSDTLVYSSGASSQPVVPEIVMPCVGSAGAGETMTFAYTLTATLP